MTDFGDDLIEAMQEAAAYVQNRRNNNDYS